MLQYNIPAFMEGDVNAFLTALARKNGLMKNVSPHHLTMPTAVLKIQRRTGLQMSLLPVVSFSRTGTRASYLITRLPQAIIDLRL